MNNIEIKYIAETDQYSINGEIWRRAEPTEAVKKPYFRKPKNGEIYYIIDNEGKIEEIIWNHDDIDKHFYHALNCWLDETELEAYIARYGVYLPDRLTLAIRRWKIANGIEDRFDWFGEREKYHIVYDKTRDKWVSAYHSTTRRILHAEYFSTEEETQKCINDLHEYFDDQLDEWNSVMNCSEGK